MCDMSKIIALYNEYNHTDILLVYIEINNHFCITAHSISVEILDLVTIKIFFMKLRKTTC